MDIISILGLVLGLAVLIMMGFKGWGMIPTSIVGALVVVITNRMDLGEALSTHYGTFMKNYAGDYFLMFFPGHAVRRTDGEQRCGQIHRL